MNWIHVGRSRYPEDGMYISILSLNLPGFYLLIAYDNGKWVFELEIH